MRYSKEILYHFSCEKCLNWWSFPSSEYIEEDFHKSNTWFCPRCAHEHKPPHIDKDTVPSMASENFLETFRENE